MIHHVLFHVLRRDINIFKKYESLREGTRDLAVSYMTEPLFALLPA